MIVKDMNESVKFYTDTMGFKIDSEHYPPNAKITLLKGEGDTLLELIQDDKNKIGLYSIGMAVENMDSAVRELKLKGVEFILEPTKISIGLMAMFKDPNDINIVLIHHD
jgi:lactoylglutathione lyase